MEDAQKTEAEAWKAQRAEIHITAQRKVKRARRMEIAQWIFFGLTVLLTLLLVVISLRAGSYQGITSWFLNFFFMILLMYLSAVPAIIASILALINYFCVIKNRSLLKRFFLIAGLFELVRLLLLWLIDSGRL